MHLFVAEVVKPFETVDRGVLDCVFESRKGLPGWFRHAYFEYRAHVRLCASNLLLVLVSLGLGTEGRGREGGREGGEGRGGEGREGEGRGGEGYSARVLFEHETVCALVSVPGQVTWGPAPTVCCQP